MRIPVFGVFNKVLHKPAVTVTGAGQKLEILDLVEEELYPCHVYP